MTSPSFHNNNNIKNVNDGNAVDDVDKYAESLLSCPVCLERFDGDNVMNGRRAKSLPDCRHTFCLPCLRRCCDSASSRGVGDFVTDADRRRDYAGRSFPCPTCRRQCRVPDVTGGLDALPDDFRIAQVRELIDRMRKATSVGLATKVATARRAQLAAVSGPQCSVCQMADDREAIDERQAQVRCSTCDRDFCRRCADRHANSVVFRDHVTQPIVRPSTVDDQLDDDGDDGDGNWKCLEHGESFGYYCARCERPVCTACIIDVSGGHDQHPVTARDESATTLTAVLAERLKSIKQRIDAIELARQLTAELRSRREAMYRETLGDIQRSAAEARHLIDTVENELKDEAQRLHDSDEQSIAATDERWDSEQRKFIELSDAIGRAMKRLAETNVSQCQSTVGLRGFRTFSELIRSSADAEETLDGNAGVRALSVPDEVCRGMVMMSDVFIRIGNVERQKIHLSGLVKESSSVVDNKSSPAASGRLDIEKLDGGNSSVSGSNIHQSAPVVINSSSSLQLQPSNVVASVILSSVSPFNAAHESQKLRSQQDNSDDDSSSLGTVKSVARMDLKGHSSTNVAAHATNLHDDNRAHKDGGGDDEQKPTWRSDSLTAGRGACFIERGELVVADSPNNSSATGGDLWSQATRARSSGSGSIDRVKVFDCTGEVIRRLTGSVVTEPWAIGYDPMTNGGGSVIITDRTSTAIKILKMTLSFRDLTLWRPAGVIKPNAVGVLMTDSNSSMYILTDAARQSASRISLHVPAASRIARLRSFDADSETSGTGCGLNFVTVDRCGRILVSDSETGNISGYDVEGRRVMSFAYRGQDDEEVARSATGGSARRMVPQGIAVDAANNILVADQSGSHGGRDGLPAEEAHGRILKFSSDGRFIEVVRRWAISDGGRPWGLAYNDDGRVLAVTTDTGVRVYRL